MKHTPWNLDAYRYFYGDATEEHLLVNRKIEGGRPCCHSRLLPAPTLFPKTRQKNPAIYVSQNPKT